jgi:TldD protein
VSRVRTVDESFLALPLSALTDAALTRALDLGCEHADIRVERIRAQTITLRDARLEAFADAEDLGLSVRVVHEGTWGFAAGVVLTAAEAVRLAEEAVAVAQVSAALATDRVELAPEPVYPDASYVSEYDVDPFEVSDAEKTALLVELSETLMAADGVDHVQSGCMHVKEQKYYADTAGTRTRQPRVRIHPEFTALTVDRATGQFESMRTLAPPVGRGWEYLGHEGWDWRGELAEIPELLREKTKAPSVEAGRYDLVVDPSNLFLTIHESIGHATELDRALGYEAAYAGTSFATVDKLGTLQYGSPLMNVTGDRTARHGLSTIGWDDEGVAGQQWDIIKDGTLVGYQLNRQMAQANAQQLGVSDGRSNGCAFADSPGHIPLQRMANVSLQPAADGPSIDELIGDVERGIYIKGDRSWSIDMQRFNFQFTGQQFHKIENGRLVGQLRDVAYQATTTDFWGAMEAVGGPDTYVLGGAFNCGKGQPGQVASVSHGCPTALFRDINVLNTKAEGGRK